MEQWQQDVCTRARLWIGTPFVPHAHVCGVGVDCAWLLREVYEPTFGPFSPMPDYAIDWAKNSGEEKYLSFIMPYVEEVCRPVIGGFSLLRIGLAYSQSAILLDDGNYVYAWGRHRLGSVTVTPSRVILSYAIKTKSPVRHYRPR
jgi:hypothetical protein